MANQLTRILYVRYSMILQYSAGKYFFKNLRKNGDKLNALTKTGSEECLPNVQRQEGDIN